MSVIYRCRSCRAEYNCLFGCSVCPICLGELVEEDQDG
jgi:hypothetical protein